MEFLASVVVAILAYGAVYFIGKPVVALQAKRIEVLDVAERYSGVDAAAPEETRDAAVKALFEAGTSLRAYERGWSTAVRLWCWAWGYDLDLAAQALYGLAEGPRAKMVIPPEARRNTLNALYVALGAAKHLPPETVDAIRRMIVETKAARAKASA